MQLTKKDIESLYESSKMTSIKEYHDENIVLQTKKWQDPWSINWWEFVTAVLIFMIKENVSDLHIEANNSINYRIRYRKNKKLYTLKFSQIENIIREFFDEKNINKEIQEQIINRYKLLFINDDIEIIYEENQILQKLINDWIISKEDIENWEIEFNEKKFKLSNLKVINEAFVSLFSLVDIEKNQDTSIDIIYKKKKYSYRIAMKRQSIEIDWFWFYSWVIRLLMTKFFSLRKLWINEYEEFIRSKILNKSLNIIWWETNSWKSTTIFSLLKEVYDAENWQIKLYTVEEPIEKQLWFLTQLEIKEVSENKNSNFSFKDAERFLMRADPDWMLVWEIRDYETANTALKFAVTWHYTYATLHIKNTLQVKERFLNWWIWEDALSAIWFVEVTELVSLYKNSKNNLVFKLKDLISSINTNYLKEYIQILWMSFEEQEKKLKEFNQEELTKLKFLINWSKEIRDLFLYKYINEKNKNILNEIWNKESAEYNLKKLYLKYLKFLPSYFSNIFLDNKNIITKKNINLFLKWYFDKYNIIESNIDELIYNKLLFSKNTDEKKNEIIKILKEFVSDFLSKNNKIQNKKEIIEDVKKFLSWKFISESGIKFTIYFNDFINFLLNQYVVLWKKTIWVVPIVEFYDYEEVKYIHSWIKDVIFKSSVFTPMFLFWLMKLQKNNNENSKWIINLTDILKMFKNEYKLKF